MPDYLSVGMTDRPVECPIHPDDDHLPLSYLLRRRGLFTHLENGCPKGYQVAQRGEFRYIDREFSQYRSPIGQIQRRTGSKMIANGRFWTEDRLMGQTMDPETGKPGLFGIPFPDGMIQDPSHRTEGKTLHVRHDPKGYSLRRRLMYTHPEKEGPEPHQVAQRGEFRYIEGKICQNWSPIVRILYEPASKMIANGCYWTEDRLTGRAIDPETRKNRFFRISSPAWMIQDPCYRTEGETLHVRHDPKGYSLRLRLPFTHPENRCPKGYQVAQKGEFRYIVLGIRDYRARIARNRYETGSKMIANGCFPAGDRLQGRTADRGIQKNPCFSGGTAECQEGRIMKTNGEPGGMS